MFAAHKVFANDRTAERFEKRCCIYDEDAYTTFDPRAETFTVHAEVPERFIKQRNMNSQALSDIQQALQRFASQNGRCWKAELRKCWERASYPGVPEQDKPLLQTARNALGPSWLSSYTVEKRKDTPS